MNWVPDKDILGFLLRLEKRYMGHAAHTSNP